MNNDALQAVFLQQPDLSNLWRTNAFSKKIMQVKCQGRNFSHTLEPKRIKMEPEWKKGPTPTMTITHAGTFMKRYALSSITCK